MQSTPPVTSTSFNRQVSSDEGGTRLDHYLVRRIPEQSRSRLAGFIRSGHIQVNNATVKPGCRLQAGDEIQITFPEAVGNSPIAQPVAFEVIFEDSGLVVLSKPPGLVVHPAAGHPDHTLVNGLLHRFPEVAAMEGDRPGIVHRLDKDTSGIMLAAKTEKMQRQLSAAFKERQVQKTYQAILLRTPTAASGRVNAPIGRHRVNRKKMAILTRSGRYAVSNWKILKRYSDPFCLAEIAIETGRTHQIRVHMASLGCPVAGDSLYGGKIPSGRSITANRQLLHASTLALVHPKTRRQLHFTAPLWPDMEQLVAQLEKDSFAKGL